MLCLVCGSEIELKPELTTDGRVVGSCGDAFLLKGLRAFNEEINRRNYQGILGLKAKISKKDYWYLLEVLPPKNFNGNSFCMSEFLTGPLTTKAWKEKNRYYAQVVDYRLEKKDGANYGYPDEYDH